MGAMAGTGQSAATAWSAQRRYDIAYSQCMYARGNVVPFNDELGIAKAFFEALGKVMSDPFKLAQVQIGLWQDYMALWQQSMLRMMGQEAKPVAEASRGEPSAVYVSVQIDPSA